MKDFVLPFLPDCEWHSAEYQQLRAEIEADAEGFRQWLGQCCTIDDRLRDADPCSLDPAELLDSGTRQAALFSRGQRKLSLLRKCDRLLAMHAVEATNRANRLRESCCDEDLPEHERIAARDEAKRLPKLTYREEREKNASAIADLENRLNAVRDKAFTASV